MKIIRKTLLMPLVASMCMVSAHAQTASEQITRRVDKLLLANPIIDGHNDLSELLRERYAADFDQIDLRGDTAKLPRPPNAPALMTDIPRLRSGRVGGQFWSVWIPVSVSGPVAVKMTMEQIDLVKRMVQRYPETFSMAGTAHDVERAFKTGKVASLIGIEGGHQIDHSLAILRQMYDLGARYMTLTHSTNTPWADSATDDPVHHGMTAFGKTLVREMNRIGMLVDLSHVSPETMRVALEVTRSPVILSHSGARAVVEHPRNVSDELLKMLAANGGVIMVNFAPGYVSQAMANWEADEAAEKSRFSRPPFAGLYLGQPDKAKAAMQNWLKGHPMPVVTVAMVADHIDHIRKVAGVDSVGIGSDYDGIPYAPSGLESVDKYPRLFEELARRGWSDADLVKLANGNILRVMRANEAVAKRLQATEPAAVDSYGKPW